ncbi:MAG: ATP synthase F1 subunit delta [Dehalococcoidales bacterium]|nr:ATP synthase F1 subunit delta [Dehalococcoidales bacterium]
MARKTHARRYAQAVFELALAAKQVDRWQDDLAKVMSVVGDAAFGAYLASPKVRFADKDKKLSEWLNTVSPLALNLVRLLIVRGKLGIIGSVVSEYGHLTDRYNGIERAEVMTAVPLEDKERQSVTKRLEELLGKKIVVSTRVEPALVGGMVARIDGKLLDGSTRSRLAALKRDVAGAGK